MPRGTGILLAWALLPVAANFVYWHHGSHLGPRMLFEAGPAWILLSALAASGIVRALRRERERGDPARGKSADPRTGKGSGSEGAAVGRGRGLPAPARIAAWSLGACLLAAPLLATMRARSYGWDQAALARLRLPDPPGGGRSLVFVHGSWAERITARLQAAGMRSDSIETGLRRNDICRLHHYALERARSVGTPSHSGRAAGTAEPLPELDLRPLPGTPDHLRFLEHSPGNRVRVDPRVPPSAECRREAGADRLGVVALAPLLWQGDLPGIDDGRPLVVRDLGPGANARVLRRHPDRA
ncbi:MAG: hypothetical protein GWM92_12610, partial [Gemmatimonadetes bacterium]|nr:hypothetical protein [Gemmatimonadota bacterium]NIR79544.1 hypothetical protein [Gemmatimonadota bacterium]NIT88220.1 hypothetical protein [Gemmatimonadota bacterium]NIU32028.1 hypothetical protein [Gemmatimonadota bacterium]NIU36637.1 hypothetical protein [Gemmatimonadota bacterium]